MKILKLNMIMLFNFTIISLISGIRSSCFQGDPDVISSVLVLFNESFLPLRLWTKSFYSLLMIV